MDYMNIEDTNNTFKFAEYLNIRHKAGIYINPKQSKCANKYFPLFLIFEKNARKTEWKIDTKTEIPSDDYIYFFVILFNKFLRGRTSFAQYPYSSIFRLLFGGWCGVLYQKRGHNTHS